MNEAFATARRPAEHDGASAITRFFRYHGIWAPGVRLFRSIGFRAKALTITAVFLLPIAWLSYNYFSDKAAAIQFSADEREGVAYARAALPLLTALHQQRMAAVQEAASGQPAPGAEAARAAVQAALKPLNEAQARLGAHLRTGAAHAQVLELLQTLPAPSAGVEPVLNAHNKLVSAHLALLTTSTDNSNLTLDPDLDTYYLMDGSLGALPVLLEATALHRDIALAMLSGHSASSEMVKQLGAQEAIGDLTDERWATGLGKVKTVHADIETELGSAAAQEALHSFHKVAAASESAPRVLAAADATLSALAAAQNESLQKLDDLLQARIDRLEQARAVTAVVLFVSLLLVWYLFLSFRKVLEGGLKEVAFHINAMSDGDLTTRPRAWGSDEAAGLMQTLADMQASLRKIVSQVRGASSNIVVASTQIASGAMDLSTRTEESAANLQQTAAAMEEVSATVSRGSDTVDQATQLAVANAAAAERGGAVVAQVVETMQGINVASGRISDIIGTIDGIAFQTNILALNAAVEAARAGEQGRGFAVVASEVRALAQRSAAAAREIKTLITASVEQVEGGVRVVREAGHSMSEMQGGARRVRELLEAVAQGSREQTQGVTQSAEAVQELDKVTQQNAALVEETAAAAGSLKDQAEALASGVAQFKLPEPA